MPGPSVFTLCIAIHSLALLKLAAASATTEMPASTGSGRLSQRSTSGAKSGDFWVKNAKQDAKSY
jgi:hypothetical protein